MGEPIAKGRPTSPETKTWIRECKRHGEGPHYNFAAGSGRRRWMCKRCTAEAVTRRHRKVRRILLDEAGGSCAVCGYARCISNLHFHHVHPALKSFEMTLASGKSLERYRGEMEKCVLVCANCHGEIEAGLIASPPPLGPRTAKPSDPNARSTLEERPCRLPGLDDLEQLP